MATNLPSCFSIQFLEKLLKFLVNFALLKYVKSQRKLNLLDVVSKQVTDLQKSVEFAHEEITYIKIGNLLTVKVDSALANERKELTE